jgi:hypothetical protein
MTPLVASSARLCSSATSMMVLLCLAGSGCDTLEPAPWLWWRMGHGRAIRYRKELSWRAGGTTLLLTTQYLDEADELADEIVVIDRGLVIAAGTSAELKGRVGGDVLEFTVPDRSRLADAVRAVAKLSDGEAHVDDGTGVVSVGVGGGGSEALVQSVRVLARSAMLTI